MDSENLFIFMLLSLFAVYIFVVIGNEKEKELEILKKNKDFEIYNHCIEFDKEWYCYD